MVYIYILFFKYELSSEGPMLGTQVWPAAVFIIMLRGLGKGVQGTEIELLNRRHMYRQKRNFR